MPSTSQAALPGRVSDLMALKHQGAAVTCSTSFQILPVDFNHQRQSFQAHVFLCRFEGVAAGKPYGFRKCYARGCPHNLCPHVSQAVMIANRYLQRDYRRLKQAGIQVHEHLFTLDDMIVKFERLKDTRGPVMTIHDVIGLAREGNGVALEVVLELVPAVEHFAGVQKAQTFLTAQFAVDCLGAASRLERCLACYETQQQDAQRPGAVALANERLKLLYGEFDGAGIRYEKRFYAA